MGEAVLIQKSGQVTNPIDLNGSAVNSCWGSWSGKLSASRKSKSSNEEKIIAKTLNWKWVICTDGVTTLRISDNTMHRALREGSTTLQMCSSYSSDEARKTSIGRDEPDRRSIRKDTT